MKRIIISIILFYLTSMAIQSQIDLTNVKPWAYWLQNIDIQTIANNNSFQLIVMDYSRDGIDSLKWNKEEIASVKNSGKYVISYISIGEAEDYRFYWQSSWKNNPPNWLGPENLNWEGNYKVRFWYPEWETIIFQYIDKIIAQGFDGIYMDIIDGYYFWSEEEGSQPLADSLMCQFVIDIRNYVNEKTGNNNFILIPQNGEDIIDKENVSSELKTKYLNAINAIGVEDVFFPGDLDENNEFAPDKYRISILKEYLTNKKQVYAIDYLTQTQKINQFISACVKNNFVPYTCTRELGTLCNGISTGVSDNNTLSNEFKTYPNPATDNIEISMGKNISGKIKNLNLYNSLGQLVKTCENISKNNNSFSIDVSGLQNGIYFILLSSHEKVYSRKLIINHNK